jgi:diadenosine tetraphosphate (Ap4A) HIT family hydrolase
MKKNKQVALDYVNAMKKGCLACDLTSGKLDLPGGIIHKTKHWIVDHTIGPLPVGTLIVRPLRHCINFWELTPKEIEELGPLLHKTSLIIKTILNPDQIYICLWSHAGWKPVHIHFVLQPSWNHMKRTHKNPGPFLQVDMFKKNKLPNRKKVEIFAAKARKIVKEFQGTKIQ